MEQPKVKFVNPNSSVDQPRENKATVITNGQKNKEKVKIKSIVPANFPLKVLRKNCHGIVKNSKCSNDLDKVKIVKKGQSTVNKHLQTHSLPEEIDLTTSNTPSVSEVSIIENTFDPCSMKTNERNNKLEIDKCMEKLKTLSLPESANIPYNSVNTGEQNKNHENIITKNKSTRSIKKPTVSSSVNLKNDSDIEILEISHNLKKKFDDTSQQLEMKHKHLNQIKNIHTISNETNEKENEENCYKSTVPNRSDSKISNVPNILKDTSNVPFTVSENSNTKQYNKTNTLQSMPTANFKKKMQKQVQKKSLLNFVGNHSNVSVQSGSSLKKFSVNSNNNCKKVSNRKNIISTDLSHPEYNSSVSIMKKIKEIEKEKIITDTEHLPPAYKNLLNEKISAALDFPPCESVYKNLINLTVDDDTPVKLLRSRDPEPRNKDIVPKLSDFYNPRSTEQYFNVASPKIRDPININNLNAFKISNKMCTWKICRDRNF